MSPTETDPVAGLDRRRRDQLLELVGRDRRVLAVEPAPGLVGELSTRGCEVVERASHDELVGAGDSFDVVVLDDLLTTVADPEGLLKEAASALVDTGTVVVTATNAAHAAARLALLGGDPATYAGGGRSPVRAFTPDSLCELLEGAGLVVDGLHAVVLDPLDADPALRPDRLPPGVVEWVRHQPDALVHTLAAVVRPRGVDEEVPARPRIRGDRPLADSRRVDEHTEQAEALREDAHRRLTTRDAIIGLEHTALVAELRRDQALDAVKTWKKRSRKWRAAHDELAAEVVRAADDERRPGAALQALADRCRGLLTRGERDGGDDAGDAQ